MMYFPCEYIQEISAYYFRTWRTCDSTDIYFLWFGEIMEGWKYDR